MWDIFRKELHSFFDSWVGVLVMVLFVLVSGLVFWVLPETSLLRYGQASMEVYFELAPYLLLCFVPALCMRSFAGERADGTLDWLFSKPIGEVSLIAGKFLAVFLVLLLSVLPSLLYVFSIYQLAMPRGNVDLGAIWGGYLGLLGLSVAFIAIGLACSVMFRSPVFAFLLSMSLCLVVYEGGHYWADVADWSLATAYQSLSRALLDTRDFAYIFAVAAVFFLCLGTYLRQMRAGTRKRKQEWWKFLIWMVCVGAIYSLSTLFYTRWDLNEGNRYALSDISKQTLHSLPQVDAVRISLCFQGSNLPSEFKRLHRGATALLRDFQREAGNHKLKLEEWNPHQLNEKERHAFHQMLATQGLQPIQWTSQIADGTRVQRLLYPFAVISHGDQVMTVNLLQQRQGLSQDEVINHSLENLEYQLVSAIRKVMRGGRPMIGFTEGHGELNDEELADAFASLSPFYQVGRVDLASISLKALNAIDVLVVAKPQLPFHEPEKFKLDQFLMRGGRIIWSLDQTNAELDSLRRTKAQTQVVRALDLGLEDLLFHYGLRFRPVLLLDLNCASIPTKAQPLQNLSAEGDFEWIPWPLHPILVPQSTHPLVRQLDAIKGENMGVIDTLSRSGVHMQILLHSSPFARALPVPAQISLNLVNNLPEAQAFRAQPLPVMALLEGKFSSAYKNRGLPVTLKGQLDAGEIVSTGKPTSMIAIADGDFFKNQQHPGDGSPYPLGWDRFTGKYYANKVLLHNIMDFLTDDRALLHLRRKEFPLRLLDPTQIRGRELHWQLLNLGFPLILILLGSGWYRLQRLRSYRPKRVRTQ